VTWKWQERLKLGAMLFVLLFLGIALARLWGEYQRARSQILDLQNRAALADSTRVILQSTNRIITERLAEQRQANVELTGKLGELARANREQGAALLGIRIAFDSILARTGGQVRADSADSAVRVLEARLDTAGIHVGVVGRVPPPPALGRVDWRVHLDTIAVLQSLTRSPTGQAIWRAEVRAGAKALADTIVFEQEKQAPKLFGIRLPDLGGALLVAIPAILAGFVVGQAVP
jgi:hypothetical protein